MKAGPFGKAAAVLVCVTAFIQLLLALTDWQNYPSYQDDPRNWHAEVNVPIMAVFVVALVAAAFTFISWLRQVRANAEMLCKAPHRHGRGWVIGGWFVPVISLWYPKQIVDDVIAASSPRTSPHAESLPQEPSGIVLIWWATWIGSTLLDLAVPTTPDSPTAGDLLMTATFSIASAVLSVVCAVYAVRVIRLVNGLQTSRPWIAWWETEDTRLG
jgi:heme/copper-type cytochrome/quinol oxidase subunit 2